MEIPVAEAGRASERDTGGGWPAHRPIPGGKRWELTLGTAGAAPPAGDAVTPPTTEDLALDLHRLPTIPEDAGTVWLPEVHRAFPCRVAARGAPPVAVIATPSYLLARLQHLGVGQRNLLATADEGELLLRAGEILGGRGAACHFEVRRPPGAPAAPPAVSGPDAGDLEAARTPEALRRIGLHAPKPGIRTEASLRAAREEPDNAVGQLLAGCAHAERREPARAAEAFRRAADLDPEFAAAHFELGKTLIRLDDLEGALDAFWRAARALPEFASAWANAGAALGELERTAEALEPLERASALDPLNHSFVSNLGVTLRDLGRLPEAEAAFRRALELAPDFVFGRYNLAYAVFLRGRHQEAVTLFEQARSQDPSRSARQGLLLAIARLAAGDEEGARAGYEQVFDSLSGRMRMDMRTVAEWDLRGLARREGVTPALRRTVERIRAVRA